LGEFYDGWNNVDYRHHRYAGDDGWSFQHGMALLITGFPGDAGTIFLPGD
jgi:hypothetical protein